MGLKMKNSETLGSLTRGQWPKTVTSNQMRSKWEQVSTTLHTHIIDEFQKICRS